jgi:membrane protein YdbS with pleckstrin-like domain
LPNPHPTEKAVFFQKTDSQNFQFWNNIFEGADERKTKIYKCVPLYINKMVTLREKYPLENRKPLKKTIASIWSFIFIIIFIGIFSFSFLSSANRIFPNFNLWIIVYIFIGVFVLFIILKYVYEVFYMKYYFYDLVGKNLIIKKGVFSRNEITLPINRLQDVYVDQDILDRIFGLYDVHVSSATIISGNLSHIDGVNKENAQAIKNLILSGIHKESD